jgi:hypothetical protein
MEGPGPFVELSNLLKAGNIKHTAFMVRIPGSGRISRQNGPNGLIPGKWYFPAGRGPKV